MLAMSIREDCINLMKVEDTVAIVGGVKCVGKDQRQHRHELHDNVQGRSGGILERISDGVTNNGGLVDVRSLALELRVGRLLLNVLLGVIPCTSRVRHGDGELDRGNQRTDQKTRDGTDTKEDTSQERSEDNHGTWGNHLLQRSLGRDSNAGIVVRALSWILIKKVWLLVELTLDFHNHLHGGQTNRLHGHGSESEWDHSTDNQKGKSQWLKHIDAVSEPLAIRSMADTGNKGTEECKGNKSSGTDGESLSDGSSGVSSGIQSISLLTDTRVKFGHLGNTSSVITDWSVNINGQTSSQVRKESNGSKGNSVHVAQVKGKVDDKGKNNDGDDGRLESKGNSVDHVGGGSSLTRVGDLTDWLVGMRSVILGDQTNSQSTNGSHADADGGLHGGQRERLASDSRFKFKGGRKEVVSSKVDSWDHENSGTDELNLQGGFNVSLGLDRLDVGGNERADQAHKDTDSGNDDGENHGIPVTVSSDTGSNDKSGTGGFSKRSKQIRSHTGNITDIITNIISNSGRVTWIILGDSVNNLSDQISTDIGSLGVDTSTDTTKHGNDRSTKTVSSEGLCKKDPVLGARILRAEDKHGDVKHQHSHSAKSETCCNVGKSSTNEKQFHE
mmetsp:Transcript_22080/g.54564  ORF Transcript_22080/g.54564 Transcript_22080/m.54564 type:complete len:615 (-) Transcript_22080:38-1882(-)